MTSKSKQSDHLESKPESESGRPADSDFNDEFAISTFALMGYEEPLPSSLIRCYQHYKRHSDRLRPGRLSPEAFAFVATLSDMVEGRLDMGVPED